MTVTNNVTRMLDARKVKYTAHVLPEEKLGAKQAAQLIGVPSEVVFKTIVAVRATPGKPILAVIPGDQELNLKLLAKSIGDKKVKLASHQQAESLTGLQTGGISPLALINKGFQVLVDSSALSHPAIFVSGGQRGLNIEITPQDLLAITSARTAALCSD
ncbi:MAG: aminoacyl-tRNA deacylase [Anaerolineales bacterium]|nr:aminoacyl-tRNA deacylase [Anaerolineales bacterium]